MMMQWRSLVPKAGQMRRAIAMFVKGPMHTSVIFPVNASVFDRNRGTFHTVADTARVLGSK